MDKDLIVSIVGELYLTNTILNRKLEEKDKEIEKLRLQLKEFGAGLNNGGQG